MPASRKVPRDTSDVKAGCLKCTFYCVIDQSPGPLRIRGITRRLCNRMASGMRHNKPACTAHQQQRGDVRIPWSLKEERILARVYEDSWAARIAHTEKIRNRLCRTRLTQALAMKRAGIPIPLIDAIVVACEEKL